MPIQPPGGGAAISRIYHGAPNAEIDHVYLGGPSPAIFDKRLVPAIASFTAAPASFIVSPQPPPVVRLDWAVTGDDSLVIQERIPYFADDPAGVVTPLTPDAVADGSVSLTSAVANAPWPDHFGFDLADGVGAIADQATSLVRRLGGHRSRRNDIVNFHISWTGEPTSGQVYGRYVPTTGNSVDFVLNTFLTAFGPAGKQVPAWGAANFSPAGVWNAASGLPTGKIFLYSDAARTQQINLRSIPISDGSSVTRQLPHNAAWLYIRNYGFVLTATNTRGKSVARVNVQRQRMPTINYFRMRAGSFRRNAFNNSHRWIIAEFEVDGYPRPSLSLTYAPGNAFSHPLRLTAADPRRRTVYDENAANPDLGVGDEQISILVGSGLAQYRLTATNPVTSVSSDFSFDWPI